MSKALDGVRILDFTHVQSGPTCTQLLAWMGADVIKVERAGEGDITRGQLRDIPGVDSLYFTMLNHNKRSITVDAKHPKGKEVLEALVAQMRRAGREFRAGRARPHGLHLGAHPGAESGDDRRFGQGLRPRTLRGLQGLRKRRAVRRRVGVDHRFRRRPTSGHRRADRRLGHRPASRARHRRRALSAQDHRARPARPRGDAGRRAQPLPGKAARSAAPGPDARDGGIPAVSERQVRRRRAARRQCLGRRSARVDSQMQGLGDRPERLHLLHNAGAGVERHLRGHRPRRNG